MARAGTKTKAVGQGLEVKDKPPVQSADQAKTIKTLLSKGNTEREIAAVTGLPKTTVHRRITELRKDTDYLSWKDNKADEMEGIQWELIKLADQSTLKKMLERRGMTDVAILEDKIRLIRGQSTDNQSVIVTHIRDLQSRLRGDDVNRD